jgi:riboflavin kinase/FMN adenylyltransferase
MSLFRLNPQELPPAACRGGVLSLGNFDGVHRGHAALIAEAARQARGRAVPAVALTFDPHPLQLLRPESFQPILTTIEERAALLHAAGADHVIVLETTADLLQRSAGDFFQTVILDRLAAQALVEGPNFAFGHNREGTVDTLKRLCGQAGMDLTVLPPVLHEGKPISSSRVRRALEQGTVGEAAILMGHSYRLRGRVVAGQRRGRTLGFPTANLEELPTLIPGDGVYAVRVELASPAARPVEKGGKEECPLFWPGAANIGPNPTFGENRRKVEVHLIGFNGDLLGQALAIDFLDRIRNTRKFASAEQLVEQLRHDVEKAEQMAAKPGKSASDCD